MQQIASNSNPTSRSKRGASIALILACVIGLLGLLGFFVFNYTRIFGAQREAQTAIDAAALEAAKQASTVFISTNLGSIGLVDMGPDASAGRPRIIGINTALATARLDALIAQDLGNTSMQVLANRDITELQNNVIPQLTAAIRNKLSDPNVIAQVKTVYNNNAARSFRDGQQTAADTIQLSYGGFKSANVSINIRTPDGADPTIDGSNSTGNLPDRFYKANVAIASPGGTNVTFGAVGDNPRIVDNGEFDINPAGILPTAVQVTAVSHIKGSGPTSGTTVDQNLTNVATALCGAGIVTNTSTTYCVSFPSGFPSDPAFFAVKSLMNSASISSATQTPSSNSSLYAALPASTWFRAPANGTIPPGPTIGGTQGAFDVGGGNVRTQDFPPVALAFGMYDWVRSMGLRIDRRTMVEALSANLTNFVNSNNYANPVKFAWDGTQPAYAANAAPPVQNAAWMSLPSDPNQDARYNAVTHMDTDTNGVANIANAFGYEFPGNVTPKEAAATVVTQNSVSTTDGQDIKELGDAQNQVCRTNHAAECAKLAGQQVSASKSAEATDFKNKANAANAQAASDKKQMDTLNAQIAAEQAKTTPNQSLISSLQQQVAALQTDMDAQTAAAADNSAKAAAAQAVADLAGKIAGNGGHIQDQTYAMLTNLQALTGLGCNEKDTYHFTIAASNFTAYSSAAGDNNFLDHPSSSQVQAMANAILAAKDASDAGLSTGTPGSGWADNALSSYSHTGTPVTIAHRVRTGSDILAQPAYAALPGTAIPPNNNLMFLFNIQGDYQKSKACTVTITPLPMSPFFNNTTSNGQSFYYAPGAISTSINGLKISWTCTARDNAANGKNFSQKSEQNNIAQIDPNYCSKPNTYNMSLDTSNGNACPTLGGEFRIGCPVPGGCVGSATITNNGTLSVTPCPPPPPQMG